LRCYILGWQKHEGEEEIPSVYSPLVNEVYSGSIVSRNANHVREIRLPSRRSSPVSLSQIKGLAGQNGKIFQSVKAIKRWLKTYLRRIELKMAVAGRKRSVEEITDDMPHLHYVLSVKKGSRTPERRPETPSKTQSEVLSAFGCHVDDSGVLQGPVG
jgi:hypothetical protein